MLYSIKTICVGVLCAGLLLALNPSLAEIQSPVLEEGATSPVDDLINDDPHPSHEFQLNSNSVRKLLANAPMEEGVLRAKVGLTLLPLPLPDGQNVLLQVTESPLMEPELAARYPDIHTYTLVGNEDKQLRGRLLISQLGISVILLTPSGTVHINPLRNNDASSPYMSVFEHDSLQDNGEFCGFNDPVTDFDWTTVQLERKSGLSGNLVQPILQFASGDELRTYRLAIATTGEYYAGRGGNDNVVMASIMTELSLINAIYESEVAIRLVLIGNTDDLFFTNSATDGYTNASPCTMRGENVTVTDSTIDSDSYDIGHVFGTSPGGGCAGGSVVCGVNKANGASGINVARPVGHNNFGGYRLVLHELGHQFGASHVWSGISGNCTAGQFAAASAYENGGGTTIMSYSGTCGSDDIQTSTTVDTYFNSHSYEQVTAFATGGNGDTCPVTTATNNTAPIVNAGPDYVIPQNTPFVLTGSAIDNEGHPLTYTWEQHDLSNPMAQKVLDIDDGSGPIFRSFPPTSDPSRTFPQFSDVLNNTQTAGEILPSTDRGLEFRLTARDNRAAGGGVDWDTVNLTVEGDPFFITAPNGTEIFGAGCPVDVTWTVGGGNVAASVDLLYSIDNGSSFPTTLLSEVINDGADTVEVLPCDTGMARFRLNSVDNIFFDLSDSASFIAQIPPEVDVLAEGGEVDDNCEFEVPFEATIVDDCGINAATIEVEVFQQDMNFTLGLPDFTVQQVDGQTISVTGSVLVSSLLSSPATLAVQVTGVDLCGAAANASSEVMVSDTTPPEISVSVSPNSLWPPNHKMSTIMADVTVTDNCPVVSFEMTGLSSNEPDNGQADGDTVNDIQNAEIGTPDIEFNVRSERSGKGGGRIYTVTYTASDGSNNTTDDSETVSVPHHQ